MNSTCDICGFRGTEVRAGLVIWKDLAQPYNAIDRCTDVIACRARVESQGEEWPVVDVYASESRTGRSSEPLVSVLGTGRAEASSPLPKQQPPAAPLGLEPARPVRPDEVKG